MFYTSLGSAEISRGDSGDAMDPIWYTIRIVVTGIMTAIGGLLLWAAYAVADNLTGAALAWMVLLGLAIPSGFFALFTLVGWQRSTASGAVPNDLIAWCNDPRRYPLLWVGFVVILFGSAYQIMAEIRRGDTDRAARQAFERSVRNDLGNACYARAHQAIGADLADVGLKSRVPNYCTCLDLEVEKRYTPQQFAEVPKDQWWATGDDKIDRIVQKCRLDDSSLVRAVRVIRKNGGDPDSNEMRSKILDYSACVKVELESGYTDTELMKVSADTAWQDSDQKFQPIIGRCMKYAGW